MGDNLPRPITPGPWEAHAGEVVNDSRALQAYIGEDRDALAVAALHERIRRMDAVRALCERVSRQGANERAGIADTARGNLAMYVLDLLDGEATDA